MLPAVHSLRPQAGSRADEVVSPLAEGRAFRLEHIASHAAASPPGFWYDQDRPEWVALLHGTASLEFAEGTLHLQPGDCLLIPAHLKHRVSATSPDAAWLALHFEPGSADK
ncbi:MAG TPA: AraC family ligand binding domain-containing protein [Opitutus sp.]|nr:AraC family ligand binding domain-containing protein [Opitutus sp.]